MVYIGIDLGGTSVKVGLVDENGKILAKESCPTLVERGAEPVINDMANLSLRIPEPAECPSARTCAGLTWTSSAS